MSASRFNVRWRQGASAATSGRDNARTTSDTSAAIVASSLFEARSAANSARRSAAGIGSLMPRISSATNRACDSPAAAAWVARAAESAPDRRTLSLMTPLRSLLGSACGSNAAASFGKELCVQRSRKDPTILLPEPRNRKRVSSLRKLTR